MALIACPECRKKVSDSAGSYPNCGYQLTPEKIAEFKKMKPETQERSKARHWKSSGRETKKFVSIGWLSIAGIFVLLYLFSTSDSPRRSSTSRLVSIGQEMRISGDTWFGCTDRDYFEKLIEYAGQKDKEAVKNALVAGFLVGTCEGFENGEAVYIVDRAVFSNLVKVRRKGETKEYWTGIKAVE